MSMRLKPVKCLIAAITCAVFVTTSVFGPPSGFAANFEPPRAVATGSAIGTEIPDLTRLDTSIRFSIPEELGTLEYFKPGKGPAIVHLQTAHGHYQAQKQIQAILHYLDDHYGIRTLLVEGSAFQLEPELLNFFPGNPDLTRQANDALTRAAWVKGSELYLLDTVQQVKQDNEKRMMDETSGFSSSVIRHAASSLAAQAYGIEELQSYRDNGRAFVDVLTKKKQTEAFLAALDEGINRFSAVYLHEELRGFLRQLEFFEQGRMTFEGWLSYLCKQSLKHLKLDLGQPAAQVDWPMLVRAFKIQELSAKFDKNAFPNEREKFLAAIKRFVPRTNPESRGTLPEIEELLRSDSNSRQLPDPETSILFEEMVRALPSNFNYAAYPNVRFFIGRLLLQSELKGAELMMELNRLSERIAVQLAKSKIERGLVEVLKDYRLLQKLFALELMPGDYEQILGGWKKEDGGRLKPSNLVKQLNRAILHPSSSIQRVKNVSFPHLAELDALYEKAMKFYSGVKERDGAMKRMIEKRLRETGADKVAVITGGFHAGPLKDYFVSKNYSYALIAPKLSGADEKGHEAYVRNMLQFSDSGRRMTDEANSFSPSSTLHPPSSTPSVVATRESEFLSDPQVLRGAYGINAEAMRAEVRRIVSEVAGATTLSPSPVLSLGERDGVRGFEAAISAANRSEVRDAKETRIAFSGVAEENEWIRSAILRIATQTEEGKVRLLYASTFDIPREIIRVNGRPVSSFDLEHLNLKKGDTVTFEVPERTLKRLNVTDLPTQGAIYHRTRVGVLRLIIENSGGLLWPDSLFALAPGNAISIAKPFEDTKEGDTESIRLAFDVTRLRGQEIKFGSFYRGSLLDFRSFDRVPLSTLTDESKKEAVSSLLALEKSEPQVWKIDREKLAKGLGFENWTELIEKIFSRDDSSLLKTLARSEARRESDALRVPGDVKNRLVTPDSSHVTYIPENRSEMRDQGPQTEMEADYGESLASRKLTDHGKNRIEFLEKFQEDVAARYFLAAGIPQGWVKWHIIFDPSMEKTTFLRTYELVMRDPDFQDILDKNTKEAVYDALDHADDDKSVKRIRHVVRELFSNRAGRIKDFSATLGGIEQINLNLETKVGRDYAIHFFPAVARTMETIKEETARKFREAGLSAEDLRDLFVASLTAGDSELVSASYPQVASAIHDVGFNLNDEEGLHAAADFLEKVAQILEIMEMAEEMGLVPWRSEVREAADAEEDVSLESLRALIQTISEQVKQKTGIAPLIPRGTFQPRKNQIRLLTPGQIGQWSEEQVQNWGNKERRVWEERRREFLGVSVLTTKTVPELRADDFLKLSDWEIVRFINEGQLKLLTDLQRKWLKRRLIKLLGRTKKRAGTVLDAGITSSSPLLPHSLRLLLDGILFRLFQKTGLHSVAISQFLRDFSGTPSNFSGPQKSLNQNKVFRETVDELKKVFEGIHDEAQRRLVAGYIRETEYIPGGIVSPLKYEKYWQDDLNLSMVNHFLQRLSRYGIFPSDIRPLLTPEAIQREVLHVKALTKLVAVRPPAFPEPLRSKLKNKKSAQRIVRALWFLIASGYSYNETDYPSAMLPDIGKQAEALREYILHASVVPAATTSPRSELRTLVEMVALALAQVVPEWLSPLGIVFVSASWAFQHAMLKGYSNYFLNRIHPPPGGHFHFRTVLFILMSGGLFFSLAPLWIYFCVMTSLSAWVFGTNWYIWKVGSMEKIFKDHYSNISSRRARYNSVLDDCIRFVRLGEVKTARILFMTFFETPAETRFRRSLGVKFSNPRAVRLDASEAEKMAGSKYQWALNALTSSGVNPPGEMPSPSLASAILHNSILAPKAAAVSLSEHETQKGARSELRAKIFDEGAKKYFERNQNFFKKVPSFKNFKEFLDWFKKNRKRLKSLESPNAVISAGYAVLVLTHAGKIAVEKQHEFQMNAGAYEYGEGSAVIDGAPQFEKFEDFWDWFEKNRSRLVSKENPGKVLGASYTIQVLIHAKKISLQKRRSFQFRASAYDYADQSAVIQTAPEFNSFDEFLAWYRENRAKLVSKENSGKVLGAGYTVLSLFHAGKILGKAQDFQRDAGAFDYAEHSAVIQKAPRFDEFEAFRDWYQANKVGLVSRENPRKVLGAIYTIQVLVHAGKIAADKRQNFQRKAGAYERALKEKKVISAEMRRIWTPDVLPQERLYRLKKDFDVNLLSNLKTFSSGVRAPLSKSYRDLILIYAFQEYGAEVTRGLEVERLGRAAGAGFGTADFVSRSELRSPLTQISEKAAQWRPMAISAVLFFCATFLSIGVGAGAAFVVYLAFTKASFLSLEDSLVWGGMLLLAAAGEIAVGVSVWNFLSNRLKGFREELISTSNRLGRAASVREVQMLKAVDRHDQDALKRFKDDPLMSLLVSRFMLKSDWIIQDGHISQMKKNYAILEELVPTLRNLSSEQHRRQLALERRRMIQLLVSDDWYRQDRHIGEMHRVVKFLEELGATEAEMTFASNRVSSVLADLLKDDGESLFERLMRSRAPSAKYLWGVYSVYHGEIFEPLMKMGTSIVQTVANIAAALERAEIYVGNETGDGSVKEAINLLPAIEEAKKIIADASAAARSELRDGQIEEIDRERVLEKLGPVFQAFKFDQASAKTSLEEAINKAMRLYIYGMTLQHLSPRKVRKDDMNGPHAPLRIRNKKGSLNGISDTGNAIVTAMLSDEELKKAGVFSITDLQNHPRMKEFLEAASKTSFVALILDGGIGESLMRQEWLLNKALRKLLKHVLTGEDKKDPKYRDALSALKKAEEGGKTKEIKEALQEIEKLAFPGKKPLQVKMGAKGTDLGRMERIRGNAFFVGDAEARLLYIIHLAETKTFGKISFQPIVNYQSKVSYETLLKQTYLWDVVEGRQDPRTYEQALRDAGVEIPEMLEMRDLPKFEIELDDRVGFPTSDGEDIRKGQTGGHGQPGIYLMVDFTDNPPAQDGFEHHGRWFLNGDNRFSRPDVLITGASAVLGLPIVKIVTPATAIDKKGGKEVVRIVQTKIDGRETVLNILDQWEEIDAKNAGQADTFYAAGQRKGFGKEGKQLFNTNLFYFNIDLLHPILKQMREIVGPDEFLDGIMPTLFDKSEKAQIIDGKRYVSMDSALGYVVHRLNTFYVTDARFDDLRKQYGPQLLYYVNYDRGIFAPKKTALDQYLQEGTDYYGGFDEKMRNYRQADPGLVPPRIELTDPVEKDGRSSDSKFWAEAQRWLDSFGCSRIRRLNSLTVEGRITLLNAEYAGDVVIINRYHRGQNSGQAKRVVLSSGPYLEQLKAMGYWEGDHLKLENVQIMIDEKGQLTVNSSGVFRTEEGSLILWDPATAQEAIKELRERGVTVIEGRNLQFKNAGALTIRLEGIDAGNTQPGITLVFGDNVVIEGVRMNLVMGGRNVVNITQGTKFRGGVKGGLDLNVFLREGESLRADPGVLQGTVRDLAQKGKVSRQNILKDYLNLIAKGQLAEATFIRKIVESLSATAFTNGKTRLTENADWVRREIEKSESSGRSEVRVSQFPNNHPALPLMQNDWRKILGRNPQYFQLVGKQGNWTAFDAEDDQLLKEFVLEAVLGSSLREEIDGRQLLFVMDRGQVRIFEKGEELDSLLRKNTVLFSKARRVLDQAIRRVDSGSEVVINSDKDIIISSDQHLGNGKRGDFFAGRKEAFLRLISEAERLGTKFILAGDFLELKKFKLDEVAQAYPEIFDALKKITGGVYWLAGNHDWEVLEKYRATALALVNGDKGEGPLSISPYLLIKTPRGFYVIEHGQFHYDSWLARAVPFVLQRLEKVWPQAERFLERSLYELQSFLSNQFPFLNLWFEKDSLERLRQIAQVVNWYLGISSEDKRERRIILGHTHVPAGPDDGRAGQILWGETGFGRVNIGVWADRGLPPKQNGWVYIRKDGGMELKQGVPEPANIWDRSELRRDKQETSFFSGSVSSIKQNSGPYLLSVFGPFGMAALGFLFGGIAGALSGYVVASVGGLIFHVANAGHSQISFEKKSSEFDENNTVPRSEPQRSEIRNGHLEFRVSQPRGRATQPSSQDKVFKVYIFLVNEKVKEEIGGFFLPIKQGPGRQTYTIPTFDAEIGRFRNISFTVKIDTRGVLTEVENVRIVSPLVGEDNSPSLARYTNVQSVLEGFLKTKIGQLWGPDLFRQREKKSRKDGNRNRPRSEVRQTLSVASEVKRRTSPANEVKFVWEQFSQPDVIRLIEQYYFKIVPMRMYREIARAEGREAFAEVLQNYLGVMVASASEETHALRNLIPGDRDLALRDNAAAAIFSNAQSLTPNAMNQNGILALGQSIYKKLIDENPRALYYLLKSFSGRSDVPGLLVVGSPELMVAIKEAIIRKGVVDASEFEACVKILRALEQGKLLKIEPLVSGENETVTFNRLAISNQGGMVTLHLGAAELSGLGEGVHFAFDEKLGSEDLLVASALAIALKSMADLIRNVPDPEVRSELLKKFIAENLPGASPRGGNSFVITQISKLAEAFVAQSRIAAAA